jgi:undecaprenyl-diphosphatase
VRVGARGAEAGLGGVGVTLLESVLLGVIQGIFMFFPVSSTSHLVLTQHYLVSSGSALPAPESGTMILFDLVVHLGTLVSIAVVFRKSLAGFVRRLSTDLAGIYGGQPLWPLPLYVKLAMLGCLSVLVTGLIGIPLEAALVGVFSKPWMIAITLTITGLLLYWTDRIGPRPRGLRDITVLVALVIGLAQALALMPGLSRSGLTIAFALFVGLKRRWAAEYSFFIAFPTIVGATFYQILWLVRNDEPLALGFAPLAVGFAVAALVGIVALRLVLGLLYRAKFRFFAYYVWTLAAIVLFLTTRGTI